MNKRLVSWIRACDVWGFEIHPPFSSATLGGLAPGEVQFRATRKATVAGEHVEVSLDVEEAWLPSDHPDGDWRLNDEGCHAGAVKWHLQVGTGTDDKHKNAERLEVAQEDATHPRIHRHPYGERNDVREPAEFPVPEGWLSQVNAVLDGAFDDDLQSWDHVADKED